MRLSRLGNNVCTDHDRLAIYLLLLIPIYLLPPHPPGGFGTPLPVMTSEEGRGIDNYGPFPKKI